MSHNYIIYISCVLTSIHSKVRINSSHKLSYLSKVKYISQTRNNTGPKADTFSETYLYKTPTQDQHLVYNTTQVSGKSRQVKDIRIQNRTGVKLKAQQRGDFVELVVAVVVVVVVVVGAVVVVAVNVAVKIFCFVIFFCLLSLK